MTRQPFVDLLDPDEDMVWKVLDLATSIKSQPRQHSSSLQGKTLYGVYEGTCASTQLSFSRAASLVGCGYVCHRREDSVFQTADVEPHARYLSSDVDFLVVRLNDTSEVQRIAHSCKIPVINAGCANFDPMQALTDAFTLLTYFGAIGGQRFVYVGGANSLLNSLVALLTGLGVHVVAFILGGRTEFRGSHAKGRLAGSSLCEFVMNPTAARLRAEVVNADVVYFDGPMEESESDNPHSTGEFRLTHDLYSTSEAVVMHRLSRRPGSGIEPSMLDHPNAVIHLQAVNRAYVQASALLCASGFASRTANTE